MSAAIQNLKVQKFITALSVVLFLAKLIAYYFTNSLAVLSDALESIVNVMAGFIGLYSLYVAAKPRDADHPYGHGKAEFVSAAAEGALIIASGMFIFYETFANIISNKPLQQLNTGLYIIAVTAFINWVAGYLCVRTGRKNNSLALQASGKHLQVDTYSTLAIIAALIIIMYTNIVWIDKAVAFVLGAIIIYNGYKILRESLAGIMDEADKKLLGEIIVLLNANRRENWIDLHNLRVIKYGAILHIDAHLTVPWYLNVHEAHLEIDGLVQLIQSRYGESVELFVHTDGCMPFSCTVCTKKDCSVRQKPFVKLQQWDFENLLSNKKHTAEGERAQDNEIVN